jgi:hypothetical protein
MPVYVGEDLVIQVESEIAGVFLTVADMNRYASTNARTTTTVPVFAGPAHELTGERNKTFTLEGLWNDDDPGQVRLRAKADADEPVKIRVLPDGVNGFECTILQGTDGGEASADESTFQSYTVDAEMQDDETPIGTGVLV